MRVMCLHTAGLGELVEASLSADMKARVLYADDSAMLVDTAAPVDGFGKLGYVKNCFAVIGSVPRSRDMHRSVETILRSLSKWKVRRSGNDFRLMFSEDGALIGIPQNSRERLISALSSGTGGRFTPRGGGDEYWVLARRDLDEVLFCQRLARPVREAPPKGGLAADIAELIVRAGGRARPDDVVLDPFAGTGALIAARVQTPFKKAICSDLGYDDDVQLQAQLAKKPGVKQISEDARDLTSIPDHSVDAVFTDPPWGEFDGGEESAMTLIDDAVISMSRVLKPGKRLTMLVSRRLAEDTEDSLAASNIRLVADYELLLNGHPATVLVGELTPTQT